jgi:glycosyltransferase involved in cell wall biosynthesis
MSWSKDTRRVVIQTASHLDFQGNYSAGGRQRYVCDLTDVIKDKWGPDVLIVQKGSKNFEETDEAGRAVIGIKSRLDTLGDALFAIAVRKLLRKGDALLYGSGEDAWPFIVEGAKAVHHGVWWDGPFPMYKKVIQRARALSLARKCHSIASVDTNFINWLRNSGVDGYLLAGKCNYIPNYADCSAIAVRASRPPSGPVKLVCARRNEFKRGLDLFIDTCAVLQSKKFDFLATIFTTSGIDELERMIRNKGLSERLTVESESMSGILGRYCNFDICVVPTRWSEGTSLTCAEAIAAGLPVVATPVGGLGNLVIPHFNGLMASPNAECLADAISRLAEEKFFLRAHHACIGMRSSLDKPRWDLEMTNWLKA